MMLPEHNQVLVVDDEPNLRRVLSAQLQRDGYEVHAAGDGAQALQILEEHHIDLVITDLRMPQVDGMQLLRSALEMDETMPVVIITAYGTIDTAVEALKTGAFDYVTKPFDQNEVRTIVKKALKTRDLASAEARREPPTASDEGAQYGIIGNSPAILELRSILERVADTPTTVLITGESGTGKELVARALHENSARKDKPFIKVNCAAIPRDLMEAELFGYERGAFAGAVNSKPGRFELANGGTLFLDEVAAIPVELQVKLLRALQESCFERVGGVKTLTVDVRVVTASNRELAAEMANGAFREDLYYRLNVVPIRLPSLRERPSDIEHLANHFVQRYNARLKKRIAGIEREALRVLTAYDWPGNIRQLENAIERAVLFCDGARLQAASLPPEVRDHAPAPRVSTGSEPPGSEVTVTDGLKQQVKAAMSRLETELIVKALGQTRGNVTHAARLLKISRKGLQLKMKELGLRERDGRAES